MKDIKLILFFCCFFGFASAQFDSTILKSAKPRTLKKLGKNALKQNDPASAIIFLESYLKKEPKDAQAMAMLGGAFMKTRDYERAQRTYLRAYNKNKEKAPEALYYHAQMQKSNGLYDSAKYNFSKFKKEYKGDKKMLKRMATREIGFCDSVKQLITTEHKLVIQHLDTAINKVHVEAAPTNMNDNEMVFTSFRTEKKEYQVEDDTVGGVKRKLYLARRDTSGWRFMGEFGDVFNESGAHTGNACFSPDRKRIYFTRCRLNYLEEMTCAIYVSTKQGDSWSEPVRLPKSVNNPKYTSTMPAVTIDPKKGNDIVYFVSNRKGGKGGLDIYYTTQDKKTGEYKAPKNAGAKINTSEDEMSPFFDTDTRTLYFSSTGWGGLGGFDIFKTKGDGKKWTGIENVGQPFNTGADDIFYTISTNREEGFFVSNRKGGNALKNATCCDDIYYYKHSEYIRINLRGNIREIPGGSLVPDATVEIYLIDKNTQERILVKTLQADSVAFYSTTLEPGQDYVLMVKKQDFLGSSENLTTKGITTNRVIDLDLKLSKKPKHAVHIPNVKYQYDRSELEESSKASLDSTVYKLMTTNPELIIEIMAHTDGKGTDAYNLKLSQRRAESIVKYLIGQGIPKERLRAQGYGESQPVAPNENADGSDNPEGRAKNRRTDFRIVGILESEVIDDSEGGGN